MRGREIHINNPNGPILRSAEDDVLGSQNDNCIIPSFGVELKYLVPSLIILAIRCAPQARNIHTSASGKTELVLTNSLGCIQKSVSVWKYSSVWEEVIGFLSTIHEQCSGNIQRNNIL